MEDINSDDDEHLIHKMQTLHSEKFAVLCRMHLSFLLDLTSEELNEIYKGEKIPDTKPTKRTFLGPLHRKNKGAVEAWDGTSIESLVKCSEVLEALIRFLGRDQNICQEGLFRKSGKKSRQQELRGKIISEGIQTLEGEHAYSVHDCASVLKGYLADLPEPLLSEAHYKAHCQIAGLCKSSFNEEQRATAKARQIQSLQLLFLLLPKENRRLLQELLDMLNRVSQERNGNLMDAANLATMFAPHILCPRKMTAEALVENSRNMTQAIAFMVENAAQLFNVPSALMHDVRAAMRQDTDHRISQNSLSVSSKDALEVIGCNAPMAEDGEDAEDPDAVKTVITFCDRRPVSSEAGSSSSSCDSQDMTAVALAELYAYVQAMPDSHKKKQLIKQFNRETGPGASPLCTVIPKKHQRSKSLRKTIKKHLFGGSTGHQRHLSATDQSKFTSEVARHVDQRRPPLHPSSENRQRLATTVTTTIRHPAYCPRGDDNLSSELATCSKPVKSAWTIRPCIAQSTECLFVFCHRDSLQINQTSSESDLDSSSEKGVGDDEDVRLIGIRALAVSFCDSLALCSPDDSILSTSSVRSMTSFQSLYRLPKTDADMVVYRETSV